MLEGKPQKIDDAETMRAISSILSDSVQTSDARTLPRAAAGDPPAVLARLTLTPVRDVVARVAPAPSSSLHASAVPETHPEGFYADLEMKTADERADQPDLLAAKTGSRAVSWAPRISALAVLFASAMLHSDLIGFL